MYNFNFRLIVFIFGVYLFLGIGACSKNDTGSQSIDNKSAVIQKKTVSSSIDNNKKKEIVKNSKSDAKVESIFEDSTAPSADELSKRAEIEFGKGNFAKCTELFEQAAKMDKNQDLYFYNGWFHCKYQAMKLDYTHGKISEEDKKLLLPIANQISAKASNDLEYLMTAITWLMMQDRKRCAEAITEMTNYMLNSERDLSNKDVAQLKEETKKFYAFIMDDKNSFSDIAMAFEEILGFSEEEIKQQQKGAQ